VKKVVVHAHERQRDGHHRDHDSPDPSRGHRKAALAEDGA
jgi:hypothetical protein